MGKADFKVGEIVQLNSGGPEMTVEEVSTEPYHRKAPILCQWFGGKKLEHGHFPVASLKKVQPKSP